MYLHNAPYFTPYQPNTIHIPISHFHQFLQTKDPIVLQLLLTLFLNSLYKLDNIIFIQLLSILKDLFYQLNINM